MHYVYILLSKKFNKTYTGITDNLKRRLRQHNNGLNIYSKRYIPWEVKHTEVFPDRLTARAREKYLKSSAGRKWMKKNIFA